MRCRMVEFDGLAFWALGLCRDHLRGCGLAVLDCPNCLRKEKKYSVTELVWSRQLALWTTWNIRLKIKRMKLQPPFWGHWYVLNGKGCSNWWCKMCPVSYTLTLRLYVHVCGHVHVYICLCVKDTMYLAKPTEKKVVLRPHNSLQGSSKGHIRSVSEQIPYWEGSKCIYWRTMSPPPPWSLPLHYSLDRMGVSRRRYWILLYHLPTTCSQNNNETVGTRLMPQLTAADSTISSYSKMVATVTLTY